MPPFIKLLDATSESKEQNAPQYLPCLSTRVNSISIRNPEDESYYIPGAVHYRVSYHRRLR